MNYKSLVLYDKYWRLGYYDGILAINGLEFLSKNQGKSHDEFDNWTCVEDSKLKWKIDRSGVPEPILTEDVFNNLCHGFLWATVINKGTTDEFIAEQQKLRNK